MTPFEEVQAAVKKLTAMKRSLGVNWRLEDDLTVVHDHPDDGETYTVLTSEYEGIAASMVLLHDTIDAQIGLMESELHWAHQEYLPPGETFLILARSINRAPTR